MSARDGATLRLQGTKLWQAWSSCLPAWQQIHLWLSWQQATWGEPQNALCSPAPPSHFVNVSFTCRTLRTTPPPLAGVRGHRELDPQCLAAAGWMVDGGVHDLVDGVEQARDVLQDRGYRNISLIGPDQFHLALDHIANEMLDFVIQIQGNVGEKGGLFLSLHRLNSIFCSFVCVAALVQGMKASYTFMKETSK